MEYGDASFGNMSRVGIPFTFLLRDILQVRRDGTAVPVHCAACQFMCVRACVCETLQFDYTYQVCFCL